MGQREKLCFDWLREGDVVVLRDRSFPDWMVQRVNLQRAEVVEEPTEDSVTVRIIDHRYGDPPRSEAFSIGYGRIRYVEPGAIRERLDELESRVGNLELAGSVL